MKSSIPPAGWLVLLVLPWVYPFASGPSPAVEPLLVAVGCATLLGVLRNAGGYPPGGAVLLVLAGWLAVRSGGATAEWLASVAALWTFAAAAVWAGQGDREANARTMAQAWCLAAVCSAAMAVLQYTGFADGLQPWISASPDGTAYANLRQRNHLATLSNMGLIALLYLSHTDAARQAPGVSGWRVAVPQAASAGLLVAVNAMTTSRTGMVQTLLVVAGCWCLRSRLSLSARRLAWCAVPVYLLSAVLAPMLKGAVLGNAFVRIASQDVGCASRTLLWSNVLDLMAQKPWWGWGWRELAWAHYQGQFANRFCLIVDNAHNLPLHLAVELGVPFALAVMAGLGWLVMRGRPWAERDPARLMAWAVLLVILVHSMVEYPLWYGPFQMAAGLGVGLLWPSRFPRSGGKAPWWPQLWKASAGLAMAGVLFTAWNYWRVGQIYLSPLARAPAYQGDTLSRIGSGGLFQRQLDFAELSITPLTAANAEHQRVLALQLLHYSPEPRVIERLVEAQLRLGQLQAAREESARYAAAFPAEFGQWRPTVTGL